MENEHHNKANKLIVKLKFRTSYVMHNETHLWPMQPHHTDVHHLVLSLTNSTLHLTSCPPACLLARSFTCLHGLVHSRLAILHQSRPCIAIVDMGARHFDDRACVAIVHAHVSSCNPIGLAQCDEKLQAEHGTNTKRPSLTLQHRKSLIVVSNIISNDFIKSFKNIASSLETGTTTIVESND
jgi:hypothetical protein